MSHLQPPQGWIQTVSPRLSAPPPQQRGWIFRSASVFSRKMGRAEVPDVITVLHLNPRLFWAWLFFASRMMPFGRLPAKHREMLILRTGWNCRCLYEWGQHLEIGLKTGLSDRDILQAAGQKTSAHDPHYALLLRACDELCLGNYISDGTWADLQARYRPAQLIELTMLIGHYIMIAGFLNSAGLRLEKPVMEQLEAFEGRALKTLDLGLETVGTVTR